eukprot:Skav214641  [mRNA]  locus=scaffold1009:204307:207687:- [translate_table: standard]
MARLAPREDTGAWPPLGREPPKAAPQGAKHAAEPRREWQAANDVNHDGQWTWSKGKGKGKGRRGWWSWSSSTDVGESCG